jgi:hypothetical protein
MGLDSPKLHVKAGVDLSTLEAGGCRILSVLALAPLMLGFSLTISCGNEGHGPDDPHTKGNALDIRTRDLTPLQILQLHAYAQQQLGTELFTVLYEVPIAERAAIDDSLQAYIYGPSDPNAQHLHLQVRRGKEFPASPRPAVV